MISVNFVAPAFTAVKSTVSLIFRRDPAYIAVVLPINTPGSDDIELWDKLIVIDN